MHYIKISHTKKFILYFFPKFTFKKASFDAVAKEYSCYIEGDLIDNNFVFLIDFKKFRFRKLDFKKHSYQKPTITIEYPSVFPDISKPLLGSPVNLSIKPLSINNKPVTIYNKPVLLNKTKSCTIIEEPLILTSTVI
jgi:hypothetical protein